MVEASGLQKFYSMHGGALHVLKGIALSIRRGEIVAIMGPSGCGKTTLLNCLSGLDSLDEGTVRIAGRDLHALSDNQRSTFRAQHMGFVFQSYNLLPVLTGLENVELPLLVGGVRSREARQRASQVIEELHLSAWATHKPAEMSGGQAQRFALARALVTRPAIIWADEPTGALDSESSQQVIDLMLQMQRQHQQTFVWITHALEIATQAQRLIRLRDGLVVEDRLLASEDRPLSV